MNILVVPEPSDLCTVAMAWSGKVRLLFMLCMAGSFHLVMVPKYMSATISPVSCKPSEIPGRL